MLSLLSSLALSLTLSLLLAALFPISNTQAAPGDERWFPGFHLPGLDDTPLAYTLYAGDLIVGGEFRAAEATVANHIARLHGTDWLPLGDGFNATVWDLVVFNGDLIACGEFTATGELPVAYVARWNGSSWYAMGTGLPGPVKALAVFQDQLYCDAYRWTGSDWINVLQTDDLIRDFTQVDSQLVFGGAFTSAGGIATGSVASWNGSFVQNAFPGQDRMIRDLEIYQGQLFIIRQWVSDPYDPTPVMTWTGASWVDAGDLPASGYTQRYNALVINNDELILASSSHDLIHPDWIAFLMRWDGNDWVNMDEFYRVDPLSLFPYQDGLLIGGDFWAIDNVVTSNLVYYQNGSLSSLFPSGHGISGEVTYLAPGPEGLAAGGSMFTAGDIYSLGAALWDGGQWLFRGFEGYDLGFASGMAWHNGELHSVSYPFSDYIIYFHCVWQNDFWFYFDIYMNPAVNQLLSWNGFLLAASHDIYDASNLVQMVPFAEVTGGWVWALGTWQGQLVAGGTFSTVAGIPAEGVALFDGATWSALGTGIDGRVEAVVQHGDLLVAGGNFTQAGAVAAMNVAAWDGLSWQPLGEGLDDDVYCLLSVEGQLFAGGLFQHSGAEEVSYIARWDGERWEPLGSGTNGRVNALAEFAGRLYVGGWFDQAGGKPASKIASWYYSVVDVAEGDQDEVMAPANVPETVTLSGPVPNPFNPHTTISFTVPQADLVDLSVFDLQGQLVTTLLRERVSAGQHDITWNGRDNRGRTVPSGVYFYRLQANDFSETRRMVLVR